MSETQNTDATIPQQPEPEPVVRIHTSCTIDAEIIALMDKRCDAAKDDPNFEYSHSSIINKALRKYFGLPVDENEDKWAGRRIAVSRANRKPRANANA